MEKHHQLVPLVPETVAIVVPQLGIPLDVQRIVPHYGAPGGVMPQVV